MSIMIETFKEHEINILLESVNSFVDSFENIRILSATLSESEYVYKILLLYESNDDDDVFAQLTDAIKTASGKKSGE